MNNYMTISELTDREVLLRKYLIAGYEGLNNLSKHIIIIETPDGLNWLKGNEIIITAGHAFINDQEVKDNLVLQAKDKNVAAICIKLGRYFGNVNNKLIEDANEYGIPLFLLPKDLNYTEIVSKFYRVLYEKEHKNILKYNFAYYRLLKLRVNKSNIEDIIKETEKITGLHLNFKRFVESMENINEPFYKIEEDEFNSIISIEENRGIDEFQNNCINYAKHLIEDILKIQQSMLLSQSVNNRILTEILVENKDLSERFLFSVKRYLGWEGNCYRGIYFYSKNRLNHTSDICLQNSKIRKIFENYSNAKFLFLSDKENMIIYSNLSKKEIETFVALNQTKSYISDKNIGIAITSKYNELTALNNCYKEAKALRLINKKDLICTDDLKLRRNLVDLLLDIDKIKSIDVLNKTLLSYDQKNDSELMKTLVEFIENDLNHKITAKKLHIHTETLRYRLERIKDITDLDIKKSDDLLLLMIGVKNEKILDNLNQ